MKILGFPKFLPALKVLPKNSWRYTCRSVPYTGASQYLTGLRIEAAMSFLEKLFHCMI